MIKLFPITYQTLMILMIKLQIRQRVSIANNNKKNPLFSEDYLMILLTFNLGSKN